MPFVPITVLSNVQGSSTSGALRDFVQQKVAMNLVGITPSQIEDLVRKEQEIIDALS